MTPHRAALIVISPTGDRGRRRLEQFPFRIGRLGDNHLVLRDTRISRAHARIVEEAGAFLIEDLDSRHGLFVNGARVKRQQLFNSDRIEFGLPDSYQLVFTYEDDEIQRLLGPIGAPAGGNLPKLRALIEVARALETSLSADDVLASVVDAALHVTGSERGFLLLRKGDALDVRIARDRAGGTLASSDLRVPRHIIHRALTNRRELLAMDFNPDADNPVLPEMTAADLDLRSVICVPLVRVRAGGNDETRQISATNETVGVLYLDSRVSSADLSSGNRELLQSLALEASTVLENARLLEDARIRQRVEEEVKIARQIQMSLLPRSLPETGWFRACGSSTPSYQVGGDYFDVHQAGSGCWTSVLADVSGKGVSSALLAGLLQGAFLSSSESPERMQDLMRRVNRFLLERFQGEKYATVFHCTLEESGVLRWINAGHCPALVVCPDGSLGRLEANSLPVGIFEDAVFSVDSRQIEPGSKLVIYSDGLSDAPDAAGDRYTHQRVRRTVRAHAAESCAGLHAALRNAVADFSSGALQYDDLTLLVLEFQPR